MSDPQNLLMLSGDTVLATGRQGVFHGVLEELSRHFERIDVIGPKPEGEVTVTTLFGNVHLHPATGPRLLQVRHILGVARTLLAERRYAIITSHDYGLFYNGVAAYLLHRRTGIPYLSEIHHVPGHPRPANLRERLDRPLNRLYSRFAARHAVAIRVVNRVEMPALLEEFGVPESKIRVIPSLYLDFEVFRPRPEIEKRFDAMLCGRLVVNKRFDLALEAVGRLKLQGRPVKLLLVGSGPLKDALLAQARALRLDEGGGSLTHEPFLKTPEELARAYAASRLLVCASTSEGGPRVTCEAMACGTPVISTPVGVMPELLQSGENGFLFQWNAAELAKKMALLLDDPALAEAIGRRGRESVLPFERREMIRHYAEQLKELAAKGRR